MEKQNQKQNNLILDLIIKQAKKAEVKAFNTPSKLATIANVGVFTVDDKNVKVVLFRTGEIQFREFNKNKFKGLTVTPVMSDEDLENLFMALCEGKKEEN